MSEVIVDEEERAYLGHIRLSPFKSERTGDDKLFKTAHVPQW